MQCYLQPLKQPCTSKEDAAAGLHCVAELQALSNILWGSIYYFVIATMFQTTAII